MTTVETTPALFETSRATVYPFTQADFSHLQALHQHPDVYITTFSGFSDDARVQGELEEYLDEYNRLGISQLKVMSKEPNPRFIGRVGLQFRTFHPDFEPDYEVRVSLLPDFWGGGLATELIRATLDYSFNELKLERIILGHFQSNLKSHTIAKKMGFKQISVLETPKELVLHYELFKADYLANKEMTH
ncbi:MAG: GNAT family N-acetyltransferase [Candidatus Melainabacteria bacterium]|nr:GNAT family N-acetyltransferase [Candidatus Melainabacteria bacterium]